MNIFEMMKQLKSLQADLSNFKESLKKEVITYEDEQCKVVANAAGEVLEIKLKGNNCAEVEEHLKRAFEEIHKETKKRVKELAKSSLLGGFGLF
jgi:DNA-binding protein YbaB